MRRTLLSSRTGLLDPCVGQETGDNTISIIGVQKTHLQAGGHLGLVIGHREEQLVGHILASIQGTVGSMKQVGAYVAAGGFQVIGNGHS